MLLKIMNKHLPKNLVHKNGKRLCAIRIPTILYLTDGETLDFLRGMCTTSYVKIDMKEALRQTKSESFDMRLLLASGEKDLHASGLMGFFVGMKKGLDLTTYLRSQKIRVDIDEGAIFLSPERVYDLATRIKKTFSLKGGQKLRRMVAQYVLFHEIGHMNLDPSDELRDNRLCEGLADWFAWGASDENGKRLVDRVSLLNKNPCHNYHHLLKHLNQIDSIIEHSVEGGAEVAVRKFYQILLGMPSIEASGGGAFVVSGDVETFAGFGATNYRVLVGGRLKAVANMRGGVVCAHEIDIVTGFIPEDVRIYANKINYFDCYDSLPDHVRVVPYDVVNFQDFIRPGLIVDRFLEYLEKRLEDPSGTSLDMQQRRSLYASGQVGKDGIEVKPGEKTVWVDAYIEAYLETYLREVQDRLPGEEDSVPFVRGYPYSAIVVLSEVRGLAVQLIPMSDRESNIHSTIGEDILEIIRLPGGARLDPTRFELLAERGLRLKGDDKTPTVIIKGSRTEKHWTREDGVRDAKMDAVEDMKYLLYEKSTESRS